MSSDFSFADFSQLLTQNHPNLHNYGMVVGDRKYVIVDTVETVKTVEIVETVDTRLEWTDVKL